MKTMALIGLILVATLSTGVAAETSMTIQTNTGIRIDPITGQVKGDAETQVRGIRRPHEAPQAVNTSPGETASANTSAGTTPVTAITTADPSTATTPVALTTPPDPSTATTPVSVATPTDPNTATTPVSVATPTGLDTGTAPVGAAPPTDPGTACLSQPVVGRVQN